MLRSTARVWKLRVVELSEKKNSRLLSTRTRVWYLVRFFYPRSNFDPVLDDKRSNFREIGKFQLYTSIFQKPEIISDSDIVLNV